MAFDFEGLVKPKNTAQGDVADRLPSGLKPVTEEKKESIFPSVPDAVKDVASLFTTIPMVESVGESLVDTVKTTNAYKKYMYSDEEKLSEAKKISIETGIPENVLIANDDNLAKGREMFNFRRKQMALAPQGKNDFDIQQIYDAYPALGKLKDDTEMAIGFSHIENIKQTKGIVEAAQTGLETANLMRERENVAIKGFRGETLTDDDWKKLDESDEKLQQAKSFPDFGDSPLANVIGNTAQQVYRYVPSTGKGVVTGAALALIGAIAGGAGGSVAGGVGAVPGAIAGARYAFGLGFKWATIADMFEHMGADKYVEYLRLRDKQGNRLLSDADARLFAMVEAGAETGIEFWNYNSVMNLLGGSVHRKAIKDIVANAAGNNEAIKAGILSYAKGVAKVSGTVFAEELPEEAVQDVVEKGTWNVITGKYATNNNYKQYSASEMQDSAIGAMADAAPSVAGFSIMAGAGSTVSGVRSFARMADLRKTYTDNEIQVANGVDMVSKLQDNKAENDLYKKQPDIYEKVLHNELDGTVYAQTRIDTELALADEETAKVFYQLAQDAGYEQEDINAIVENGADLVLPTELYTSKVDSGSKMNTFIKFGEGTESIARQKQMKELYQRELEGFMDKEEGKQADLIDTLIATAFPNSGPEQDLGAEIILSYPSDPANGWKAERNSAQNNIDTRLEPIYARLREGMKQGVQLVEYGENGQRIRVSKNDAWYSDFYKANKRPPNKQELQDIAIDIYKGNGAKYGFTDWEANTAELANAFKSHADELQAELDRVNLLDSIKPNLINLSHAELGVMKGLSKEAVKVYQTVSKLADTATSKKAKQSVKTTAILLARHADRIAEIARESGMKDFTAEDYFSRMKFDFSGQGESLFKGGETVNQAGKHNLVAVHNLSIENLLHSNKMGGIAVPSVAITNVEHPLENFGEITLIGDTDLINPSASKNKVFNADVYSPRYPEVITDVDSKKIDNYADEVKALAGYKKIYQYRKPSIDDLEDDAKGGTRKLVYSTIARLMYASRNGLPLDADYKALDEFMEAHKDGFNAFLEDFLNDVSKGEKIFKGFTNLGNRKYIPHTLENVVKELTKSLQDGEGFNYGLGSLRSVVAKRYKTLKEIQKDRDKIISKEDFDKAKEVLQKEFDEITTEAVNKYTHETDFNTIDNFMDVLKDGIKHNNIEKELHDFGFEGMDVNRIRAFLTAIKNFPTEYFEAKIQRAVGINEFSGAVIPKNSPQKVRDILTKNGVPFKEYEEGQRQNVVQSFSNELNEQMGKLVLFQKGDITKTPAFIKWFKDSKVVDENGKPLILYHGTRNSFNSFVPSKGGEYGPGIYIADMQETAKWYADNVSSGTEEAKVLPVYVSMQNPFYVTKADYVKMTERSTPKTVMNRLKKQGYDGIIGTGINGYEKQYIAFSPNQIKSVDNAGTFDENNANIYYQAGENSIKPTDTISPNESIQTFNDITDENKYSQLVNQFKNGGWKGRPVLVINNGGNQGYIALTGSHRILAAKEAGIDIPIYEINIPENFNELDEEQRELWNDLFDAKRDEDLLTSAEALLEEGQIDKNVIKLLDEEVNSNYEDFQLYNQSINGSTTFLQSGERIIRLFETADQSTLAHELGHNFLADILYWGKLETAPAWLKADYDTVTKYINYDGVSELTTEQHEKFAMGFEAYLRNGEAPVKGLRGVFRKFKKWLTGLYKDFIDLGGLPSAEVRAVMDRMLVSEQEVEDEAKLQQYENGLKVIGKIVSTSDAQMYARWQNEAKEEAKEKTLAVAMKEITDSLPKQRADEIAQYEKDIREQLSEQDVFRVEAILKNNNDLTLLPALGYTEESYKEALAKAGGGLEQAVQKAVADFTKDYDSAPMSKEAIREQAEKAMRDGNYNDMLVGFELEAMRAKAESADVANDKAVKKIEEILADMETQKDDEPAKVKVLKQKIADLRYSFKWSLAEERMIQDAKMEELKRRIKENKVQVRVLKSRVEKSVTWTKEIAQDRLSRLPLAEITATKMWINLAKKSSQDALKAIKKEQWNDALKYKQQQLIYTVMATESGKIKDKVNKIIVRQQKRSSLIAQGKTKMPVNERYYFNHLLYVFGINKRDALEPVDGAENFLAMVKRFADNYEANFTDEDGNIGLPNWLLSAIGSKEVYGSRTENPLYADVKSQKKPAMGYESLKLQDFLGIADLLSTIYTIGKNADKVRTVKTADGKAISLKDAVDDLITSITANVMLEANEDTTGATKKGKVEAALDKAGELNLELVKMETIFDQIDGGKENGPAMTYFYNIVNEARNHEKRMQIEATNKMKELFKPYSTLELRKMRQDKKYKFGTSILTKEQVIVLALNSGTELNKKRILDGYNVGELTLNETLSNLTEKDWTLIHGIWKLFNSYWSDTVGVEERMTGVGLNKQEAIPFSITGKDGNVYKVSGGYYPIKYDPTKSVKAAEQQEDDIAKQMHNDNAIFGTRLGFTKERAKKAKIQRPVLLTFDVIPNALDQVIHNISHREMVRDVNRIVTNKDFQDAIVNHFGIKTYRDMKQWVRDNWAQDKKLYPGDKIFAYLRRNITAAVLGWKTTTALLNVLNIFPMSEYLGAANAAKAVKDFYTNPMQNRAFVMGKSVFMADRVNTMDRDMREVNKNLEGKANPITRFAKNEGFRLIAETDLMLAMPLWLTEYKRVFQESVTKGQDVDTIERNAIAAGDKAVRRIFGSGEIHDLAPIQKSSELMKAVTMFYSYFNIAYNALSRRNRTGSKYDLARAFLYWMVLTSIGESLIRGAINGDDPEKLIKRIGKNLIGQPLGMIPVARDIFVSTLDQIFDDKSYGGAKVSSVYDGFIRFDKARKTAVKFYDGDKDWIDLLQDSTKASNAFTGNSDTATDAVFTTMRYIQTDFDAEIGDYLKALIFDKKLEK